MIPSEVLIRLLLKSEIDILESDSKAAGPVYPKERQIAVEKYHFYLFALQHGYPEEYKSFLRVHDVLDLDGVRLGFTAETIVNELNDVENNILKKIDRVISSYKKGTVKGDFKKLVEINVKTLVDYQDWLLQNFQACYMNEYKAYEESRACELIDPDINFIEFAQSILKKNELQNGVKSLFSDQLSYEVDIIDNFSTNNSLPADKCFIKNAKIYRKKYLSIIDKSSEIILNTTLSDDAKKEYNNNNKVIKKAIDDYRLEINKLKNTASKEKLEEIKNEIDALESKIYRLLSEDKKLTLNNFLPEKYQGNREYKEYLALAEKTLSDRIKNEKSDINKFGFYLTENEINFLKANLDKIEIAKLIMDTYSDEFSISIRIGKGRVKAVQLKEKISEIIVNIENGVEGYVNHYVLNNKGQNNTENNRDLYSNNPLYAVYQTLLQDIQKQILIEETYTERGLSEINNKKLSKLRNNEAILISFLAVINVTKFATIIPKSKYKSMPSSNAHKSDGLMVNIKPSEFVGYLRKSFEKQIETRKQLLNFKTEDKYKKIANEKNIKAKNDKKLIELHDLLKHPYFEKNQAILDAFYEEKNQNLNENNEINCQNRIDKFSDGLDPGILFFPYFTEELKIFDPQKMNAAHKRAQQQDSHLINTLYDYYKMYYKSCWHGLRGLVTDNGSSFIHHDLRKEEIGKELRSDKERNIFLNELENLRTVFANHFEPINLLGFERAQLLLNEIPNIVHINVGRKKEDLYNNIVREIEENKHLINKISQKIIFNNIPPYIFDKPINTLTNDLDDNIFDLFTTIAACYNKASEDEKGVLYNLRNSVYAYIQQHKLPQDYFLYAFSQISIATDYRNEGYKFFGKALNQKKDDKPSKEFLTKASLEYHARAMESPFEEQFTYTVFEEKEYEKYPIISYDDFDSMGRVAGPGAKIIVDWREAESWNELEKFKFPDISYSSKAVGVPKSLKGLIRHLRENQNLFGLEKEKLISEFLLKKNISRIDRINSVLKILEKIEARSDQELEKEIASILDEKELQRIKSTLSTGSATIVKPLSFSMAKELIAPVGLFTADIPTFEDHINNQPFRKGLFVSKQKMDKIFRDYDLDPNLAGALFMPGIGAKVEDITPALVVNKPQKNFTSPFRTNNAPKPETGFSIERYSQTSDKPSTIERLAVKYRRNRFIPRQTTSNRLVVNGQNEMGHAYDVHLSYLDHVNDQKGNKSSRSSRISFDYIKRSSKSSDQVIDEILNKASNNNRRGFWVNSIKNTARFFNNHRNAIGHFVSSPFPSIGAGYASNIVLSVNGVNPRDAELTSDFIGGLSYPVFVWSGFALTSPLGFRGMNRYAVKLVGQKIGQSSKVLYEAVKYGGTHFYRAVGRGTQIAGRGLTVISSACNSSSVAYFSSVATPYIPVIGGVGLILLWGHSIPQGYASSREEIYALFKTGRISLGQVHEGLNIRKGGIFILPNDINNKGLYSLYDTGQGALLYHDSQGKFKILHPDLMIKAPKVPAMRMFNPNNKKTIVASKN